MGPSAANRPDLEPPARPGEEKNPREGNSEAPGVNGLAHPSSEFRRRRSVTPGCRRLRVEAPNGPDRHEGDVHGQKIGNGQQTDGEFPIVSLVSYAFL